MAVGPVIRDCLRLASCPVVIVGNPNNPVSCAMAAWYEHKTISLRLHPSICAESSVETAGATALYRGSTIDLKGFSLGGLVDSFSTSTGLLQLTNSDSQVATLEFQSSSLGGGGFTFKTDGSGGVIIAHA